MKIRPIAPLLAAATLAGAAWLPFPVASAQDQGTSPAATPASSTQRPANPADPTGHANPQMLAVLESLASLHPKPIETLTPAEARRQPTPTDAVMKLLKDRGQPTDPAHGAMQDLKVRVYTPEGDGPFPVVVYSHGGGWVIADLDTYDAGPRALCKMAGAVVVSVDYRQGPEHKFPAAHEDVYAATQWAMQHADQVNGDPKRVAVAGESAGGNMAAAVCLMAKDRNAPLPVAQVLVYPLTKADANTPSYEENKNAKPLNTAMLAWFEKYYLADPSDGRNKYFSVLDNDPAALKGLPPATVITDQIDPLRDEGRMYADKLKAAGVDVAYKNYDGVTHEFFGMAPVLDEAKEAQQFAADRLKSAFAQ